MLKIGKAEIPIHYTTMSQVEQALLFCISFQKKFSKFVERHFQQYSFLILKTYNMFEAFKFSFSIIHVIVTIIKNHPYSIFFGKIYNKEHF